MISLKKNNYNFLITLETYIKHANMTFLDQASKINRLNDWKKNLLYGFKMNQQQNNTYLAY